MKGMNYTGPGRGPFGEEPFQSMKAIGSNYVALVPEASLLQNTLALRHSFDGQWYGESTVGVLEGLEQARKQGLKVMLKPHLEPGMDLSGWDRPDLDRRDSASRVAYFQSYNEYVSGLELKTRVRTNWRGDLMTNDEEGWQLLAENYKQYILSYAVMADTMNVDLFCIGTELKAMALERPDYWVGLIDAIKEVYDGPLTYAANWDSYGSITFWDKLDLIGIDAYFPLGDHQVPSVESTVSDWEKYKKEIGLISQKFNKPVIFTEWGYESEEYAGKTPWGSSGTVNEEVQANLYEGTLKSFWKEPWFQGVFVWRWSPNGELGGSYNFTPREKPAEEVLRRWFTEE